MKATAIIPAAGWGTRMMAPKKKQYIELGAKPILHRTLEAVSSSPHINGIVLVVPEPDLQEISRFYLESPTFPKLLKVVEGGARRSDSVKNGVHAADSEYVLVHDGVRPFVTPAVIQRVLDGAMRHGAATAAMRIHDTVKKKEGEMLGEPVDRDSLVLVQTPQAFRRELLLSAYRKVSGMDCDWTDETSIAQAAGMSVTWVLGEAENIKITTQADLDLANIFLK